MTSSYPMALLATIQSVLHTVPKPCSGGGWVGAMLDDNIMNRNDNNLASIARTRLMRSV